jgi:3-hydroxybutyryl-CoA dehydratase
MSADLAATRGARVEFSRTVAESDIYLFAGLTGDFSPNHVDEAFMASTAYGRRIAHGALLVGFLSRASTLITDRCGAITTTHYPVSLGYDRIRFLKPVFIGDTIRMTYEIIGADAAKMRTSAQASVLNLKGETCAVATHIMSWIAKTASTTGN